jgi:hypothetical protein
MPGETPDVLPGDLAFLLFLFCISHDLLRRTFFTARIPLLKSVLIQIPRLWQVSYFLCMSGDSEGFPPAADLDRYASRPHDETLRRQPRPGNEVVTSVEIISFPPSLG